MSCIRGFNFSLLSTAAFIALSAGQFAEAQETEEDTAVLGTVTVTAQKREQNIQDVGIAITAFDADQLRVLKIDTAENIGDAVSGVQVYNFRGKGQPSFVVRGIGTQDFAPNTSPTAAVYLDEVYLGSNVVTGFQVFDVQRVEVLKGPQGTLFGRNTTGGAVSYTTQRPTEDFTGYVEAGLANHDTVETNFAVGGPISDKVRYRFAGRYSDQGEGYYTNRYTVDQDPFPSAPRYYNPQRNIGADENWAARFLLDADLTDTTSILFNLHAGGRDSETLPVTPIGFTQIPGAAGTCAVTAVSGSFSDPAFCGDAFGYSDQDGDPYTVGNDFVGTNTEQNVGGSVRVESAFGDIDFVSITAYDKAKKKHFADNDGAPFLELNQIRDIDFEQITQEFRLSSDAQENLFWILGAYFSNDKIDQVFCGDLNPFIGLGVACRLDFSQDTDTAALYGQAEYGFTDRLKGTFGLRYTDESRDFFSRSTFIAADGTVTVANFGLTPEDAAIIDEGIGFQNLSGKVGLDFKVTEDILLYGSYSRGFKSGGFDGDFAFVRDQLDPYEEETIDAYEAGWKTTLADGRVRLNGAVFFYDYSEPQVRVQQVSNAGLPFNQLINLDAAKVTGLEADILWRPAERLDLGASVTLLDTEFEESDPDLALFDGNELPLAASESFTVMARYEHPLQSGWNLAFQFDGKYNGEYQLNPENLGFLAQDAYFLSNARISLLDDGGKWDLSIWGKNLGEEVFAVQSYSLFGSFPVAYNSPRTYGVTLRRSW